MRRGIAAIVVSILSLATAHAEEPAYAFAPSYAAGTGDASGRLLGGTEIRNLVAHDGKLFAANGYWKDTPPDVSPGPQILVLDSAAAHWRVDHAFDEMLRIGRRRHLVISTLSEATFGTDAKGAPVSPPVSLLLASTWDLRATRTVFVRDDRTGDWPGTILAQGTPAPGFLPQIRSFGHHRDRATGADLVFAGDTVGIFSGSYDPSAAGRIRWNATPELATGEIKADAFPGLNGRLRISSFAEAAGKVFAAVGQQVWVRQDGAAPHWHLLYTNPSPRYSQTGLRGLTAVTEPGHGEFLLAAVEGNRARIVRIDPVSGAETTDLDLAGFLDAAWSTRVGYVIGAYNDMAKVAHRPAGDDLLIGIEAYLPRDAPRPPGHTILPVMSGVEAGGWFLIRHPGGHYDLHQVTAQFPTIGQNLVAVRTIAASPFPGERDVVYLGGYDANDTAAHNTAWIARGVRDGGSQ